MVKGIIHQNCPLVDVRLAWNVRVQDVVAILDTGFTGDIKVPPEKVNELGLIIDHTESIVLGNNQATDVSASSAYVFLDGMRNLVSVLIAPGEVLVGVGLLKKFGFVLNADFKKNSLILYKSE